MCTNQHIARVNRQTSTNKPSPEHTAGRYARIVLAAFHAVALSNLKAIYVLPGQLPTLPRRMNTAAETSSSNGFMDNLPETMSDCVKGLNVPLSRATK